MVLHSGSGVKVTDLCPLAKLDPHGDILRFIYEKDGGMAEEGEEAEKDLQRQKMLQRKRTSEERINKECGGEKWKKNKTEGVMGSKRGVVGKSSMKGKKSLLDKQKNIRTKRHKRGKTDLQ